MEGLLQLIKSLGLSGLMLGGTGIGDVGEFYDAFLYFFSLFLLFTFLGGCKRYSSIW